MVPASASPDPKLREFPRSRLSDAELVAAIAAGDDGALGAAWDRYATGVRMVLRGLLGGHEDVSDLLQETFLVLRGSAARIDDPDALRPYLFGVAARLAKHELRRRHRLLRWLVLTPTGQLPETAERSGAYAVSEEMQALERVVAQLGFKLRLAFMLRYVHELPPAEVAASLGVSPATSRRLVAKARERVVRLARSEPALERYLSTQEEGR